MKKYKIKKKRAAGTVGARTIATQARSMRYFSQYAAASGIESLAGLTVADTAGYARFLRTEAVTFRGSAPPSYRTQYSAFKDLRSIVRWLQSYSPNLAPAHEAFAGCEFPGVNQMRDVDYIPDSVMTQINEKYV